MNKELTNNAKSVFKAHPKEDELIVTEDGHFFFTKDKNLAVDHAHKSDIKWEVISRGAVIEVSAGFDQDEVDKAAAKEKAAADKKVAEEKAAKEKAAADKKAAEEKAAKEKAAADKKAAEEKAAKEKAAADKKAAEEKAAKGETKKD